MTRIQQLEFEDASPEAQKLLGGVRQQLGIIPNIFKVFANSPAVLEAYLGQSAALAGSELSAQLREQIALTIAGANSCDYCASAHTALGKGTGLSEAALSASLSAEAADAKTQAALSFVRSVVMDRGIVDEIALQNVRDVGFGDGEIVEMIALVGLNTFTNYLNHIAGTVIDFPVVKAA